MSNVCLFPPSLRLVSSAAPQLTDVAAPAGALLPATGGRRGEYALGDLARELRISHRPIRAIIDVLRALATDGMPLPRTPRVVNGRALTGPAVICKDSRWDAGEIDFWLDGQRPTTPSPAAAPAYVRAQLVANAERMVAAA